ncbi:Hypothetical protein GLP15_2665 [Giardia lamblia P15]|uniref:Uncharacterized protein n=1 Tax=Giardia intestinalis (strain P15) TaxID=658858 RepID=E1F4A4_GIAIA|nr:Hypothetical protein GLP15_2665 [Giardia lamblia P15]
MKMSVLFVGGTAEQCIAAALLQQRGTKCSVAGACRELGAPWIGVPISVLCGYSGTEVSVPDALPAGLSVVFTELSWTEAEQHMLAPLNYECMTEILPLNSPLILVSSVANMNEYYRFIFLEEPLSSCNGQVLHAASSIASLMRSEAYTIPQKRNIIRFLKAMEQYVKAFHLSYIEFTDREDADVSYLMMPNEVTVLKQFEKDNVQIVTVGEYFKVPLIFFSQLLCVSTESLTSLTFTDLLKGVTCLYQSLSGNRSRCVLEYGLSDIPQSFVRVLFCQGGLGISRCSAKMCPNGIQITPATGDAIEVSPTAIYIADTSLTMPVIQVVFILRDTDGALASHLCTHIAPIDSENFAVSNGHMPVNFSCILSSHVAVVRVGEGCHLRRGFLSITVCCPCKVENDRSIAAIARNIQESVRTEMPQFMGIEVQQFQTAECAVFATYYDQNKSILQSSLFTDSQVQDLKGQYTVKRHSELFTSRPSICSVSAILIGATILIKDVLGDAVGEVLNWVTDLRRTARVDACKRLFHRSKINKDGIDSDDVEQGSDKFMDGS